VTCPALGFLFVVSSGTACAGVLLEATWMVLASFFEGESDEASCLVAHETSCGILLFCEDLTPHFSRLSTSLTHHDQLKPICTKCAHACMKGFSSFPLPDGLRLIDYSSSSSSISY
jgi:hypothetical protein